MQAAGLPCIVILMFVRCNCAGTTASLLLHMLGQPHLLSALYHALMCFIAGQDRPSNGRTADSACYPCSHIDIDPATHAAQRHRASCSVQWDILVTRYLQECCFKRTVCLLLLFSSVCIIVPCPDIAPAPPRGICSWRIPNITCNFTLTDIREISLVWQCTICAV